VRIADPELAAAVREGDEAAAGSRARVLRDRHGALRLVVTRDGRVLTDVGPPTATFPAERQLVDGDGAALGTLEVSVQDARLYAGNIANDEEELEVVVRRGSDVLASTLPGRPPAVALEAQKITRAGQEFRAASFAAPDFGPGRVQVSLLEDTAPVERDTREARLYGAALLIGFFGLAFLFAVLVSRSLQRQIAGFLEAARRLGRGDFTAHVPSTAATSSRRSGRSSTSCRASSSAARGAAGRAGPAQHGDAPDRRDVRLQPGSRRPARDRPAHGAGRDRRAGRPRGGAGSPRGRADDPRPGRRGRRAFFGPCRGGVRVAARRLSGEASGDGHAALAHPLWTSPANDGDGPPRVTGAVSVARRGRPFTEPERELFHYLAGQASVSLENVGLHETVERQAVTDDLTGLANRRAFDETITTEVERSRRFEQPVALVMVDIDDFKLVNDRHGHLLGDEVLKQVADVLRASGARDRRAGPLRRRGARDGPSRHGPGGRLQPRRAHPRGDRGALHPAARR
jgi:hypothetical protein